MPAVPTACQVNGISLKSCLVSWCGCVGQGTPKGGPTFLASSGQVRAYSALFSRSHLHQLGPASLLSTRSTPAPTKTRVHAPVDLPDPKGALVGDVRRSLRGPPRWLPPKYLYDQVGSELYERITALAEYYPYRTEHMILQEAASDIVESGCPEVLVEFGSGSASKTRLLLDSLEDRGLLRGYGAIEVSESALRASFRDLSSRYPGLEFEGVLADFHDLVPLPFEGSRRLLLFLGSTIGNLDEPEGIGFLKSVVDRMTDRDRFLIGFDLVKETSVIEAAYNDAQGVTAAFNKNLLTRLNRELGADFEPDAFAHSAFFNDKESQIEMHLVARSSQRIDLGVAGFSIDIEQGDGIRTEISRKFTPSKVQLMSSAAGLERVSWFVDPRRYFAVGLFKLARSGRSAGARVLTQGASA
ncbi:MAG: L-histidine N(alpha)-methyltransferase [Longimicrobiales bacterium]